MWSVFVGLGVIVGVCIPFSLGRTGTTRRRECPSFSLSCCCLRALLRRRENGRKENEREEEREASKRRALFKEQAKRKKMCFSSPFFFLPTFPLSFLSQGPHTLKTPRNQRLPVGSATKTFPFFSSSTRVLSEIEKRKKEKSPPLSCLALFSSSIPLFTF